MEVSENPDWEDGMGFQPSKRVEGSAQWVLASMMESLRPLVSNSWMEVIESAVGLRSHETGPLHPFYRAILIIPFLPPCT